MLILLVNGEVLRHLNCRKIGSNCSCVNCLDFKQNGMLMALMLCLQILCQGYSHKIYNKKISLPSYYVNNSSRKKRGRVQEFVFDKKF